MAEDDQGEEGDDRTIELSAIAAIYPELIILPGQDSCNDNKRASLDIQVEPVRPLSIQTPTVADGSAPDEHVVIKSPNYNGHETHTLSHLPHLTVVFSLPPTYPSQQPPAVNLSTEGSWLSKDKVEELENAAPALWEEVGRDQVLYTYIDHVREAAEDAFGIHGTLEVSADLKVALLDFDMKAKRAKFEKETFDCGVCLGMLRCKKSAISADRTQSPRKAPFATVWPSAHMSSASTASRISTTHALRKEISEVSNVLHPSVPTSRQCPPCHLKQPTRSTGRLSQASFFRYLSNRRSCSAISS